MSPSRDWDANGSADPARLMRYEAWIEIVSIPSRAAYSTKAAASAGGSGRRRQAVGLSLKIWSARAPICRDRRAALSSPRWTPRCRPTGGASAGQVSRRRGSGRRRATVTLMQQSSDAATANAEAVQPLDSAQPTDDLDLLSIGL